MHESLALKSLDVRLHHGSLANFGAIINGKFSFSDLGFVRGATQVGDTYLAWCNLERGGLLFSMVDERRICKCLFNMSLK